MSNPMIKYRVRAYRRARGTSVTSLVPYIDHLFDSEADAMAVFEGETSHPENRRVTLHIVVEIPHAEMVR